MKKAKFYFLILLIFPFYLNAQLTINDIKMILKMDLDKFETYAYNNGYKFKGMQETERVFGITFKKDYGLDTKYITLYEKYFNDGKTLTYQLSKKSEYLNLKKQIELSGFKLIRIFNFDDSLVREYKNASYKVTLISGIFNGLETYELTMKLNY